MNTVNFYQHLYEAEWQTRDHLQAAVSTPLSVLVLVATGLVLLAQNFRTDHHALEIVFWSAYAVAAAGFIAAVYMLIRSFHGYVYRRIPLPSQLLAYYEGLLRHYTALGRPGLANQEFDLYLRERYVEAGDRNAVHNTNRFDYLHQANRGIILSLCALVACTVPYVLAIRLSNADSAQVQPTHEARIPHDDPADAPRDVPEPGRDSAKA
jgi:hypothetical protein